MKRIATLCVISSALLVFALANGAGAFTLNERTTVKTPNVQVHPTPHVNNMATAKGSNQKNPTTGNSSNNATDQLPAVQFKHPQ